MLYVVTIRHSRHTVHIKVQLWSNGHWLHRQRLIETLASTSTPVKRQLCYCTGFLTTLSALTSSSRCKVFRRRMQHRLRDVRAVISTAPEKADRVRAVRKLANDYVITEADTVLHDNMNWAKFGSSKSSWPSTASVQILDVQTSSSRRSSSTSIVEHGLKEYECIKHPSWTNMFDVILLICTLLTD